MDTDFDYTKITPKQLANSLAPLLYDIIARNTQYHADEALDNILVDMSVDYETSVIKLVLDLSDYDDDEQTHTEEYVVTIEKVS